MGDVPTGLGSTVVTLGNFDGVHRGHREVLTRVVREASLRGAMPVAVTFVIVVARRRQIEGMPLSSP